MAKKIVITLDTSRYEMPTEEQIKAAKKYIVDRVAVQRALEDEIDELLRDMAEDIITLCYKYNVDPKTFTFSESYNPELMREVNDLMDIYEQVMMEVIEDYATRCTTNDKRRSLLALWIVSLGRDNNNLRGTLHKYTYKFVKDLEAAVAALRYAKVGMADAIVLVKTYLHQIYNIPQVRMTFTRALSFAATYIRTQGVNPGAVGLSNNGSTNIVNMARITAGMSWMRQLMMQFEEDGAVGYWQGRGSVYPCRICDEEEGLHVGDWKNDPWPHPSCMCWRIPIYPKKQ